MNKQRRLGQGLAALLGTPLDENGAAGYAPSPYTDPAAETTARAYEQPATVPMNPPSPSGEQESSGGEQGTTLLLGVHDIQTNPFQPRRDFDEPEIASLAESLKEHDMLQPVLVRRLGDGYQLISGERRLRAAVRAGWTHVPAMLREADDRLVAELAIVENLQRKDLNPIEKAMSFKRYLDEHRCTQEDLAARLKIDRSTIANKVRLLELPESVMNSLRGGEVSEGHAKALLPLGEESEQVRFCERIREEGLSVRATERLVQERIRQLDGGPGENKKPDARRTKSEQLASLEQELRMALGTKIEIRQASRGRGKIVIHFSGHDEFERVRGILTDGGGLREAG